VELPSKNSNSKKYSPEERGRGLATDQPEELKRRSPVRPVGEKEPEEEY